MQKFKSKKGFTLAELLIVVAIIAVLTAIAVPLFVGSLNKAEKRVQEANIRVVRGIAVTRILEVEKGDSDYTIVYPAAKNGGMAEKIVGTAKVSSSGEVSEFALKALSTEKPETEGAEKAEGGGYTVTVVIDTSLDLKP